jgi:hypothetical protein
MEPNGPARRGNGPNLSGIANSSIDPRAGQHGVRAAKAPEQRPAFRAAVEMRLFAWSGV